jgi:hypothetical protein
MCCPATRNGSCSMMTTPTASLAQAKRRFASIVPGIRSVRDDSRLSGWDRPHDAMARFRDDVTVIAKPGRARDSLDWAAGFVADS